jgi:flagellar hook assembly protein FlgD
MEFLGETPTAPGTGSDDAPVYITRLEHARPNPFNPTTTIEFSVATEGHVTIRVFDAAGRVVRTLEDGHVTAGPHTTVWDGTTDSGERVASGVYFVRMEAAGANVRHRAIGKLVLLK